jgi:hypothetical protein
LKIHGLHPLLLILALLMAPRLCGAYETDQFTNRLNTIADSTVLLNGPVNQAIADAVSDWKGQRNDWKVVTSIYHDIGGHHWVDKIERWAMKSDEVERLQPGRRDSIYQGHPLWATRVAAMFGVGPTIKVNGQLIGSDKLGHFLSQGRKFYRRWLKFQDEAKAAEHSAYTERALFGQMTTGVYSNADLVANYEGFLFYRSLFEDNVIPGKPAILSWTGDGWIIQREFTWADHVNEYWDEALNINHYDGLLYPHMKERLEAFCPDYTEEPDRYEIEDEEALISRYENLQLRDTAELRLNNLCTDTDGSAGQAVTGTAAQPN